ncbi:unnamed protein product [Microthlaspi erraticum]|uniref:Uncharacterized protein n=1 Tax=Microthlaspi erraticum TaxID=1685480 RepID=A0A6D2KUH7_9BRAS|nr:unnamed protein product [Microthlaspi erraticum]
MKSGFKTGFGSTAAFGRSVGTIGRKSGRGRGRIDRIDRGRTDACRPLCCADARRCFPAAQLTSRTRTNASSDPGNYASRPAEDFHRPIPIRPTTPADRHNIRPRPFRLGQRPDCPADRPDDRPNAAVDPKPFLKPNPHNSSPKPAPT